MPDIPSLRSHTILHNLQKVTRGRFLGKVNAQGDVETVRATRGSAAKLASHVIAGQVRRGSLVGRIIRVVVGRKNFSRFESKLQENMLDSLYNTTSALLDAELSSSQAVLDKDAMTSLRGFAADWAAGKLASGHNRNITDFPRLIKKEISAHANKTRLRRGIEQAQAKVSEARTQLKEAFTRYEETVSRYSSVSEDPHAVTDADRQQIKTERAAVQAAMARTRSATSELEASLTAARAAGGQGAGAGGDHP